MSELVTAALLAGAKTLASKVALKVAEKIAALTTAGDGDLELRCSI